MSNPLATKLEGAGFAAADFDPASDATALDEAIKARGVDENTIIEILVKRSNEQRQKIKDAYKKASAKNLENALKSALTGDLEDVVLALLKTPAQYDAHQLKWAVKGFGTDEDTLIEILASRSSQRVLEIKKIYEEDFKVDLEDDIKGDTSGDFRAALLSLCEARRTEGVNEELIDSDVKDLSDATPKGKDLSPFANILTTRSPSHLRKVFEKYAQQTKMDVAKTISLRMKGDYRNCLLAIVNCANNSSAFFAERLYKSMKGIGTDENTLNRIMVTRSEIDMKQIKEEYKKKYNRTLAQDIQGDTSGDYKNILLALCGEEK